MFQRGLEFVESRASRVVHDIGVVRQLLLHARPFAAASQMAVIAAVMLEALAAPLTAIQGHVEVRGQHMLPDAHTYVVRVRPSHVATQETFEAPLGVIGARINTSRHPFLAKMLAFFNEVVKVGSAGQRMEASRLEEKTHNFTWTRMK